VSADPTAVNIQLLEETRKQINRLFDEVARLAEMNIPTADFYGEFLKRALMGLAAPAGAVWVRTPQGHLQLQHQINLRQVGLDQNDTSRQGHDELLRQAFQQGRPFHLPPHSSTGPAQPGAPAAGNPTDYETLLVPIVVDQAVAGLVEVWQSPGRNPQAIPGFMQFLTRLANLASLYIRNNKLRQMVGQEQLWTQLEAFARQVHGSLNPTEVGYLVVNEGRRLIECDRVSVAVRQGRRVSIEAISGADVVEKRSNLVQLMRALCKHVLNWGEKLTYSGVQDDSLPPNVLKALDAYLAESNSKLLVISPLKDERESESKKPARSALVMESFDPPASVEQMTARMEVVGRHATSALYNAVEHRRIPMRFLWAPLAKIQEGLGGKARAIVISVIAGLAVLIAAMIVVPYPLKMDAKGQLLPVERRWMYSPVEGTVAGFAEGIKPNAEVSEGQPLILMQDVQLELKIVQLMNEAATAEHEIQALVAQQNAATNVGDRLKVSSEAKQKRDQLIAKNRQLAALRERTHSEEGRPGYFWLRAPLSGQVLNWGFQENLTNRFVKPSEQLLRIGDPNKSWEIELKIPQKHIGQILYAYGPNAGPDAELQVDLLLASAPTRVFKGRLARGRIGGEATPNKEEVSDTEPIVQAFVRIDGEDIPEDDRIPQSLLVTGTEVHSKVRCGLRPMGYSLFYGMWEFFYEKVVFFF
jgi:hypothetical protein